MHACIVVSLMAGVRREAPGKRGFSNIGFQDQATNQVMQLQELGQGALV
jgi:hypothetical protein